MSYKQITYLAIFTLLVPQMVLAVWWNPLSWNWKGFFNKELAQESAVIEEAEKEEETPDIKTEIVKEITIEKQPKVIQRTFVKQEVPQKKVTITKTKSSLDKFEKEVSELKSELEQIISSIDASFDSTDLHKNTQRREVLVASIEEYYSYLDNDELHPDIEREILGQPLNGRDLRKELRSDGYEDFEIDYAILNGRNVMIQITDEWLEELEGLRIKFESEIAAFEKSKQDEIDRVNNDIELLYKNMEIEKPLSDYLVR